MSDEIPDFDPRPRVLKQGDTFAVFAANGDLAGHTGSDNGLFYRDTRHLSRLEMRVNNLRPVLLASSVRRDNSLFTVDLTNPDLYPAHPRPQSRGSLHLRRSRFLWDGTLYERLALHNFADAPAELILRLDFDADFADIFEVRGLSRPARGQRLDTEVRADSVRIAYLGRDARERCTTLSFDCRAPHHLSAATASFEIALQAQGATSLITAITCSGDAQRPTPPRFGPALRRAARALRRRSSAESHVYTANELFNEWCNQAQADLVMLTSDTAQGPYPFAGTPWFSCPFGRDALITGLLTLWQDPALSRGVLGFLAAHQAQERDPARDAEPGKILHEMRQGEMAALAEVPFAAYYGSLDATPLFVMLAGAYWKRTGDTAFIQDIWPNLEAALAWQDGAGDLDGDGLLEGLYCFALAATRCCGSAPGNVIPEPA
jgi:glycogen debranching enzyme